MRALRCARADRALHDRRNVRHASLSTISIDKDKRRCALTTRGHISMVLHETEIIRNDQNRWAETETLLTGYIPTLSSPFVLAEIYCILTYIMQISPQFHVIEILHDPCASPNTTKKKHTIQNTHKAKKKPNCNGMFANPKALTHRMFMYHGAYVSSTAHLSVHMQIDLNNFAIFGL